VRIESLSHLADSTVEQQLSDLVSTDRGTTARMLHHIAECQARQLYLPQGYPSVYAYCVGKHKMSDDIACKRIRAARAARRFPFILHALDDGRLHLTGVVMLAPHLTEATAEELLSAAVDKTKAEIELLLARRFPLRDVPTVLAALSLVCAPAPSPQPAPGPAGTVELVVPPVESPAPGRVEVPVSIPVDRAKVTPTSPGRYALQTPLRQETHDLLREVQDLLGHQIAPGDLDAVLNYALGVAKAKLEQRKFAATEQPRRSSRCSSSDSRHIPAEVQRAVWKRDGGQCTFTSDTGHRCEERKDVQFDHIEPYAKGGEASVGGIRLLCRAHNQYEAERGFGVEFMRHKREAARSRASEGQTQGPSSSESKAPPTESRA
jgi:5-methylcytosine-specific restriction endonuclease McrA